MSQSLRPSDPETSVAALWKRVRKRRWRLKLQNCERSRQRGYGDIAEKASRRGPAMGVIAALPAGAEPQEKSVAQATVRLACVALPALPRASIEY